MDLSHPSRASAAAAAFELSNQSEMNYARVSPPPPIPFPIWSRAAAAAAGGQLHFFFMQRKPFDELHFFLSHFFQEMLDIDENKEWRGGGGKNAKQPRKKAQEFAY